MLFRRRSALPTVSGYGTQETSKVRPSLPIGTASSRRAGSQTPQPRNPFYCSLSSPEAKTPDLVAVEVKRLKLIRHGMLASLLIFLWLVTRRSQ